jgi:hypothetical protein
MGEKCKTTREKEVTYCFRRPELLKEYCVDTSSSSALLCGQGLLVTVWQARLFRHIGLQQPLPRFPLINKHVFVRMWKKFTLASGSSTLPRRTRPFCPVLPELLAAEHECGTCMMVLRHILAVLCEMFLVRRVMTEGQVHEDPLNGLHARQV